MKRVKPRMLPQGVFSCVESESWVDWLQVVLTRKSRFDMTAGSQARQIPTQTRKRGRVGGGRKGGGAGKSIVAGGRREKTTF